MGVGYVGVYVCSVSFFIVLLMVFFGLCSVRLIRLGLFVFLVWNVVWLVVLCLVENIVCM